MRGRFVYNIRLGALVIVGLSTLCVFPTNGRTAPEPSAGTASTPTSESLAPPSPTASITPATAQIANQPAPVRQDARPPAYDREAVLLVILILALLALLFYLLLRWSHRLDQASYLGDVYQESVEDFEYRRLAVTPSEKLANEEYHREITHDSGWLQTHPQPRPPPGAAEEFDYPSFSYRLGRGVSVSKTPSSTPQSSTEISDDARQARDNRERALNEYQSEIHDWRNKVEAAVSLRYRADLADARMRAKARAKLATDVDLSSLRGRGAEFVLEFTTVVVIIFAALILGVLRILGTEQIGTLLAAIAGYVLGRATTRTRAGAGETVAGDRQARVPGTVEGNRGENGNMPR